MIEHLPLALQPPNPQHLIRPIILHDLYQLRDGCWSYRRQDEVLWKIQRALSSRRNGRGMGAVVTTPHNTVLGYGQLTAWPRCGEISDLIIEERYRSRGYGTSLIQYLMQEAQRLHMSCVEIGAAESNPRAVALYRRLGFEDNRTVYMNLGEPERELVLYMKMELPPYANHE
jgi:ribosomal protein S18 acetylase RimI-like enzyme